MYILGVRNRQHTMKKTIIRILLIILAASAVYAGVISYRERTVPMKNLIEMCSVSDGSSIVSWYEGNKTLIAKINGSGRIEKYLSFPTINQKKLYTIRGLSAGNEGLVYLLRDVKNAYDGSVEEQQLVILDFEGFMARERKVFTLANEDEKYNYGWINASGESITLIAADEDEKTAIRRSYEYGALLTGTLNIKNTLTYPLAVKLPGSGGEPEVAEEGENTRESAEQEENGDPAQLTDTPSDEQGENEDAISEGIYMAIGNSTNLVYISDSGKIYRADEENVTEVFPARNLDTLMYPTFLSYAESGYIYFGEHESGNIVKLDLANGSEDIVMPGGTALSSNSSYTPKDIVKMSMSGLNVFSAMVYNEQANAYSLLMINEGRTATVTNMKYSLLATLKNFAIHFLYTFLIAGAVIFLSLTFFYGIKNGKMIMIRLVCIAFPLIVAAMVLFGVIAYNYYRDAIKENFVKQTEDEGNMLTAVFGPESFGEIEYPFDYTSEGYSYFIQQMEKRELYTRILYYEGEELYVGVDRNNPCFYPTDMWMNTDANDLYRQAALTGSAVTGYIEDRLGRRMVCITPVGGELGQTVYLMETGIFVSNIDRYMSSYFRNFTFICVAFLFMIIVLLSIAFYNILSPINYMKQVMGDFIEGKVGARIEVRAEDELAGISHIFNKMAEDTVVARRNLEKMTDTYYRFIPAKMIHLLKTENLADLNLDSKVEGNYVLMFASVQTRQIREKNELEKLSNRFFSILNHYAGQNEVVLISDQADLHHIMMLCRRGARTAINTALAVLAKVDAENAGVAENQGMMVSFILHKCKVSFRICGDEERYIPGLFAPRMQSLLYEREFLQEMGSRILMTKQVYDLLDNKDSYANRYIGKVNTDTEKFDLFDVYDDKSAAAIKSMKHTEAAFKKAMNLFEEGFYYEAKNMFTLVLRQNKEDMVAKHYIFKCEALQKAD